MARNDDAIVVIKVAVAPNDISLFVSAWADYRDKINEEFDVLEAYLELPPEAPNVLNLPLN